MYGILHVLGALFTSTVKSVKEQIEDYDSKQRTSDGFTYIDSKGKMRLTSNDHLVFLQYDRENKINNYIDLKTNRIVKSEMPPYVKRLHDAKIKDCRENGRTVYLFKHRGLNVEPYYRSNIYKDIDNGEKYVVRQIRDRKYYFSIKTGRVVREEDNSIRLKREREGIHDDEWNKVLNVTLYEDPNFPEAKHVE